MRALTRSNNVSLHVKNISFGMRQEYDTYTRGYTLTVTYHRAAWRLAPFAALQAHSGPLGLRLRVVGLSIIH